MKSLRGIFLLLTFLFLLLLEGNTCYAAGVVELDDSNFMGNSCTVPFFSYIYFSPLFISLLVVSFVMVWVYGVGSMVAFGFISFCSSFPAHFIVLFLPFPLFALKQRNRRIGYDFFSFFLLIYFSLLLCCPVALIPTLQTWHGIVKPWLLSMPHGAVPVRNSIQSMTRSLKTTPQTNFS